MARKLLPPKPPKKRKTETAKKPAKDKPKAKAKPVEKPVEAESKTEPVEPKVVEPVPGPPQLGPRDIQLWTRAILRQAEAARQDFTAFYGFVMRHEITKKLLIPAPHQLVMFSFLKHHPQCVIRIPVSCSKTFSMAALSLWRLGRNNTRRMSIVSGAQTQAKKVLAMVKDYIVEPSLNQRLAMVFPKLVPSARATDAWTQTEITIDRPAGIRDPSLVSVGIDSKIAGSRLSDIIGDDLVDDQNTATPAARSHSESIFDGRLLSRLDPEDATATVTNTPWHRCLLPGTLVQTDTLEAARAIEHIEVNDIVLTSKGLQGVLATGKRDYSGEIIKIQEGSAWDELSVTPEHQIQTKRGWVQAQDVTSDDLLKTRARRSWTWSKIKNIQTEDYNGPVYDLKTPAHDFVAGGVIVHNSDLTYHLEIDAGWPTITMDIYGFIRVCNEDASWIEEALDTTMRVSTTRKDSHEWYRLRAFDPDPREEVPLWPERFSRDKIDRIRYGKKGESGYLPQQFSRLFLCNPFPDSANRCQRAWVEQCKRKGIGMTLVDQYDGTNPTFTGLDPGIGKGKQNDKTVFFTYEVFDDGRKRILDIEGGRFSGPVIVKKTVEKHKRYKSLIAVETNQAQLYLKQFAEDARADLPIKRHDTLKNKYSIEFGVESIFTEIQRGAWIIPCDKNGRCHPEVQAWIDECLYYQPPPTHTGDYLMASWIARETERRNFSRDPKPSVGKQRVMNQQLNIGGF
jgi:hypothetical protein